ncbi:MAG: hypothetical protein AAGH79_05185, partial [Bacteroidota bacterium]
HFAWMNQIDQKIMTDTISPEEEKALLRAVRRYEYPTFFFRKFYEVLLNYRQFLLIRLRYGAHQLVDDFIKKYQQRYWRSNQVSEKMHMATQDIVQQYARNESESDQWTSWLSDIFYDEDMDGLNRLFALVRLTFIGFNYRRFDGLLEKYQYLDQQFRSGKYYSKRLLLNYYSNRLLLHSKFKEYDQAIYYGKLSVRAKNHDYLFYATNLAAVQLRQNKAEDALATMKEAYPEMKSTPNLHAKIGFVAFYIKCLNQNGRYKNAENYAHSFLHAYKKEVLEYRWHIFFSAYLEAHLAQEQYNRVLKLIRQHRLQDLDRTYAKRANYLPTITWYYLLAQYKEGILKQDQLQKQMQGFLQTVDPESDKTSQVQDLLKVLQPHIPDIIKRLTVHPASSL